MIKRLDEDRDTMEEVYGPGTGIVFQNEHHRIYQIKNRTGEGTMTRYAVFPGVDLYYNDIHMSDSFDDNKLPKPGIMEINHCLSGRFECELPNRTMAYLGEGDLALNMLTNIPRSSWFPLSHYRGISIIVDIPKASREMEAISKALGGAAVDLGSFDRLCGSGQCFIMRSTEEVQRIFLDLYTAPEAFLESYLKLKVLELFLFLNSEEFMERQEKRPYFNKSQVETIKKIKDYLTEHVERHVTLKELSDRFNIPLTSMKLCFKGVYGCSISQYMQDYRMQMASDLLKNTGESITEIAGRAGYVNVSKFSAAFRQYAGSAPLEYRKLHVPPE